MKKFILIPFIVALISANSLAQEKIEVYEKPDVKSKVVEQILPDQKVEFLTSNSVYFLKIQFDNTTGYILKSKIPANSNLIPSSQQNKKIQPLEKLLLPESISEGQGVDAIT